MRPPIPKARGFTLIELAVVFIILALMSGGLMMALSAQRDINLQRETEERLSIVYDALLGYAATYGRLPCPATDNDALGHTQGVENPVGGGACAKNATDTVYAGFVPAATLGINKTDSDGFALDAWGHRLRYAVSLDPENAFTTGIREYYATHNNFPDQGLRVCSTAKGITGDDCASGKKLSDFAVAIIYSTGLNTRSSGGGTGLDEAENPNPGIAAGSANRIFVSHTPTPAGAENGEFDDIVLWLSPNILYHRMIQAGRLP